MKKRSLEQQLLSEAQSLAQCLKKKKLRLVLAESCTGGAAASAVSSVPGISPFFCGSWVTYQNESKANWLSVSRASLKSAGAVSETVAEQMVLAALRKTPQADIAASITGHLGPKAPRGQNGLAYLGFARRKKKEVDAVFFEIHLQEKMRGVRKERRQRQLLASLSLLMMVRSLLSS